MPTLETERLTIRPFTMDDVGDMYREIYATGDVWGPKSRAEVEDDVRYAMLMGLHADDHFWAKRAVVRKTDGAFLGTVRLSPSPNYFYRWAEEPSPRFHSVEVELAFAFGKRYWGQSYAYEASQEMIRYAFEELRLPRLVNGTGDENLRSIALHRRLGFRIFSALPWPDQSPGAPGSGIVAVLDNRTL